MDVPEASEQAPAPFLFSSEAGYALCRRILKELLPYEPHDVQIEGVCKALDKIDLFAVLPTGSGKTSFLSMYMLVVLAIQTLVDLRSAYSRCFFWGGKEGNIASFSLSSSCQCLREVRVIWSGSPALDRFDSSFAHVHGQRQLSVILGVLPRIGELK